MNWLKRNWVWLACIALGAVGLFFFGEGEKDASLEKARAEKERLRQLRKLEDEQVDPSQN